MQGFINDVVFHSLSNPIINLNIETKKLEPIQEPALACPGHWLLHGTQSFLMLVLPSHHGVLPILRLALEENLFITTTHYNLSIATLHEKMCTYIMLVAIFGQMETNNLRVPTRIIIYTFSRYELQLTSCNRWL